MAGGIVAQELEVLGQFIKNLGDGERLNTDPGYDGEINIYWDAGNSVVRMQVYSVTKGDWEAFDPTGLLAPSDVDYLVGTASSGLSNEIVVGTGPSGDLGGNWSAPTVNATHAESEHHAKYTATEAVSAVEGEATLDLSGDVTIDGAKSLAVDTIIEKDSAVGVTIEGVLIRDSLVDGITPSNHDARHERAGTDEINGDHLDITFMPSNYSRSTSPTEADDANDLAAHLAGIDDALASVGVSIKSRQAGTVSISSGNTTGTATITAVTVANCQVNFQGTSGLFAVDVAAAATPINPTDVPMTGRVALTATTTVTATRGAPYTYGSGATTTVTGYEVLEWE